MTETETNMFTETKKTFYGFEKTWKDSIEHIKSIEHGLDRGDARTILLEFKIKSLGLKASITSVDEEEFIRRLDLLETELVVALASATSRFKLKHNSVWATIIGGIKGDFEDILRKKSP
ncbi:MAG: hypothetical protein R6U44_06805 [Archaeoglobaceae archaeon]